MGTPFLFYGGISERIGLRIQKCKKSRLQLKIRFVTRRIGRVKEKNQGEMLGRRIKENGHE